MKVEILIAREDGMWDTKIEEIPDEVVAGKHIGEWCDRNLPHDRYGDAVLFALYSTDPDEEETMW